MRVSFLFVCVLVGSAFSWPADAEPTIAFVGGTLIDGNGGKPLREATVLIRGERILAVGPADEVQVPADAKRYDVAGKYLLPGFIELHTHLTNPPDDAVQSESLGTLRALHFMDLYLNAGVTAIRDAGSTIESMQALTRAQQLGYIRSPRLYPTGQLITTTGGHGEPWAYFTDGPYGFRRAVRTMFAAGFRHIKLSPPYTQEEVDAAVDEAKLHGMEVTSHIGGYYETVPPVMAKRAVLAGVDCVEHLQDAPLEVLDMIAQRGIHVVPTLQILRLFYAMPAPLPRLIYMQKERGWSMALHEEIFRQALKRRIIMGIGTDPIFDFMDQHYPRMYFDEMENFVQLGMSRLQAITAATKNGGIILQREKDLGTIEAGKLADLQVIDGDPLVSFKVLGTPLLVMVGGSVVRSSIGSSHDH